MNFAIQSIGTVDATRTAATDDFWGDKESCITLDENFHSEALAGLAEFSHVEILFVFHHVEPPNIVTRARHPRNNASWPMVGIFSQRGKNRPNRIGSTICRVIRVEGRQLVVAELDAIAGTPVIDIKPVMKEFLPRGEVSQPTWSTELMADYWKTADSMSVSSPFLPDSREPCVFQFELQQWAGIPSKK
jgi:tRNA-Thr(GGU) m(6)t(6)A37 methyltransferase TsaA